MVTCIIQIDSMDSINVSLIRDNRLLTNYIGKLPISHFINDKIDCLKVIFKPTLCNSVPEDAYKLDNVSVSNVIKSCVISYDDFKNLSSFCYKVKDIQIYNYLDINKYLFRDRQRLILVDSWSKTLASVMYMESGSIVDFRRVRFNNLSSIIHKMCEKYNCYEVINAQKSYDYVGLKSVLTNLDSVDKDRLASLKHIPYCLDVKGLDVLETSESLDWSEDSEYDDVDDVYSNEHSEGHYDEEYDESGEPSQPSKFSQPNKPGNSRNHRGAGLGTSEDYYSRKLKEQNFDVESDIDDNEADEEEGSSNNSLYDAFGGELEPKKVGFFAKLFGKKKPSKFDKSENLDSKDLDDIGFEEETSNKFNKSGKPSTPSKFGAGPRDRKSKKKDKKSNDSRFSSELGASRFSAGADDFFDESDEENSYFSHVAVGDHRSSRKSNGFNPNARKYSAVDYLFYIGFITFISCALIFGGLQFIYKEKVGILSDSYTSAIKMKNQMQSSVEVSKNPAKSPAVKVSQLNNLALPKSYKIISVDYSNNQYKIVLTIANDDNIDDFSSYLPENIVLSQIDAKNSTDGTKMYDITLVVS